MDDLETWRIDYVGETLGVLGFAAIMLTLVAALVGGLVVADAVLG